MRTRVLTAAALTFAAIAVSGKGAHAQANVTESANNYIYVDAVNGKNSNSGSQSAPLRTLQAGVSKANWMFNEKGLGSRVEVLPGTYREKVWIGNSGKATSAPFTVEAVQPGTVTVAGSDVYTDWTDEGSGTVFDHAWSYNFGACALPKGWPTGIQPIIFRREMVVVNGMPLNQVLDASLLVPGTFLVDEANNRLRVAPPAGIDLNTATVEVATRPSTLTISGRSNAVLRGITLEHAATCVNNAGAGVWKGTNVLVDQVSASMNNWGGFSVASSKNVTVQNSVGSYNGAFGIDFAHSTHVLLTNAETDYNNWRGIEGAFYDWGMGGVKFWQVHDGTVNNLLAYNNHAQGLWFDTDNRQITVSNVTLAGNLVANLQVELNYGPISMDNSVLCYGGKGIDLNSSSYFTLTNSKLFNNSGTGLVSENGQAEIFVSGPSSGRNFTDWQTGQYHNITSSYLTMTGNIIEDWSSPTQNTLGTYLNTNTWSHFVKTLISDENQWYDPQRPNAFLTAGGKRLTLTQWQKATSLDMNSVWGEPTVSDVQRRSCTPPAPTRSDFSVFADKQVYRTSNGKVVVHLVQKSFGQLYANGQADIKVKGLPQGGLVSDTEPTILPSKASINSARTITIVPGPYATPGKALRVTLVATQNGRAHTTTVSVIP